MDKDNNFSTCLGMIVSLVFLFVIGALLNGWALSTIWNWFMPPIFGLVSLTFWQAIGVAMVFELFTGIKTSETKDQSKKTYAEVFIESLLKVTLAPAMTVFFAYIVHQFAF